jgi:hypothetical protein
MTPRMIEEHQFAIYTNSAVRAEAIAAGGNYTKTHILEAKLYKKQGRIDEARTQLDAVVHADKPH